MSRNDITHILIGKNVAGSFQDVWCVLMLPILQYYWLKIFRNTGKKGIERRLLQR